MVGYLMQNKNDMPYHHSRVCCEVSNRGGKPSGRADTKSPQVFA
jgi:hypothetical protein